MCFRIGTFGLKGILSNQSDYLQNLRVAVLRSSKNLQNLRPEGDSTNVVPETAQLRSEKRKGFIAMTMMMLTTTKMTELLLKNEDDKDKGVHDHEDDSRNNLEQTNYLLFLKSRLGEAMP